MGGNKCGIPSVYYKSRHWIICGCTAFDEGQSLPFVTNDGLDSIIPAPKNGQSVSGTSLDRILERRQELQIGCVVLCFFAQLTPCAIEHRLARVRVATRRYPHAGMSQRRFIVPMLQQRCTVGPQQQNGGYIIGHNNSELSDRPRINNRELEWTLEERIGHVDRQPLALQDQLGNGRFDLRLDNSEHAADVAQD